MASGGAWKSITDMEDNISIDELNVLLDAHRSAVFQQQKFAAALKGVDLGEQKTGGAGEKTFEDIRREAEEEVLGKRADNIGSERADLAQFGIRVEEEEY